MNVDILLNICFFILICIVFIIVLVFSFVEYHIESKEDNFNKIVTNKTLEKYKLGENVCSDCSYNENNRTDWRLILYCVTCLNRLSRSEK